MRTSKFLVSVKTLSFYSSAVLLGLCALVILHEKGHNYWVKRQGSKIYEHIGIGVRSSSSTTGNSNSNSRTTFMPILMPVCGRFEFLQQTLDSLASVENVEESLLVISDDCWRRYGPLKTRISLDRINRKMSVIILDHQKPYAGIPTYLMGNSEYATSSNIYFLLDFGFEYLKAPAVILLESDLDPTRDLFNYFQWAYSRWQQEKSSDESLISISAYSMEPKESLQRIDPNNLGAFHLKEGRFIGWGWMTSRRMWRSFMKPNWALFNSWDLAIENVRKRLGKKSLNPLQSRVKNIGYQGENFKMSREQYESSEFNRIYLEKETARDYSNVKEEKILTTE